MKSYWRCCESACTIHQYSLRGLDRKKLELEDELAIKTDTLFIDETECMGMRRSMSVNV